MDKMIVVVFDTEAQAYEGSRALADLHRESSLTLYSDAVIARDPDGRLAVRQAAGQGAAGTALGMATGALIGVLGGPAGVALGATAGALGGSIADYSRLGVGLDFLDEVSKKLSPGKTAIVAEIEEDWVTPLDARMEELGGTIYRRARVDVVDAQMERDAAAMQGELDELQAEVDQAKGQAKAKLQAKLDDAKAKVEAAKDRAKSRLDEMNKETQDRIQSLQDQASKAAGDAKARIEKRIDAMKADSQSRSDKLAEAWHLTKEALSPTRIHR